MYTLPISHSIWQNHTTSTAVLQCIGSFSIKSTVNMEAFGFGNRPASPEGKLEVDVLLSHVLSHLACMYRCFLHGPICIFFSFMHFLAATHKILIRVCNLSTFPTNTSGSLRTSRLYSSLDLAISNSARKFTSMITLTSPFLWFELSITSKKVCSPAERFNS